MHYKRYYGATVRDALRAVKEDLGPSALVLSTRTVRSKGIRGWIGGRGVEVTAAAERPEVSEDRTPRPGGRPDAQANSIAARLEASGVDPVLARTLADHPALQVRGIGGPALKRALAEQLVPLAAETDDVAAVEVFVGPPGVGKTTTIAKIAAQARA